MENLPLYIPIVFGITVIAALYIFYKAAGNSKGFLWLAIAWIVLQSIVSGTGFYTHPTKPPRFLLLAMPPVLFVLLCFGTKRGKAFLSTIDLKQLTLIHILRILVELVLFWLYTNHAAPQAMTFEGRNFDILSGITAPLIYYFGFVKQTLSKPIIIIWNIICAGLLLNVVIIAVSSVSKAPQIADSVMKGIAIQYFPFVLLPGFLVPLVLFSNIATIRQLIIKKKA